MQAWMAVFPNGTMVVLEAPTRAAADEKLRPIGNPKEADVQPLPEGYLVRINAPRSAREMARW